MSYKFQFMSPSRSRGATVPHKNAGFTFETIRQRIPFLVCLSEEEFLILRNMEGLKERTVPKEGIIVSADDTSQYMYIILFGAVKAVIEDKDGKERIAAIHRTGDYFGEMALLDGKTAPATVKAMEKTAVVLLPKSIFEEYLLKKEKVLRELNLLLCERLRESWATISILCIPDAEERVRSFLKYLSKKGTLVFGGKVIKGQLTHQAIADQLSLSRETVTRTLNKLEKGGEIEVLSGKSILFRQ